MIKKILHKFGLPILVVLIVVLSFTSYYFYKKSTTDTTNNTQKLVDDVVHKVGMLIVLPEGETPTLATVTNLDALKGQIFFADAQLGDKVLMYANAKKAILYNPNINKVVNIAPIDTNPPTTQAQINTASPTDTTVQKSSSKNFTAITSTKKKKK